MEVCKCSANKSHCSTLSPPPPNLSSNPPRTRIDKVNAELVTLTYGTIVAQLCKDFDGDYVEVNKQLDKMGYNIGLRLIEDYLAKSITMKRCSNFRETADMISKVPFLSAIASTFLRPPPCFPRPFLPSCMLSKD